MQEIGNSFDNFATALIYSVDNGRFKAVAWKTNDTL